MKKLVFSFVLALALAGTSYAQDLITKNDGTDIKAKILEVSPTEIRYKNWDNLEGPTFVIHTSEILIVRYSNGTNQVFKNRKESSSDIADVYYASDESKLQDGMRYKDLKSLYDKSDYAKLNNPHYSVGRPWLNLIYPGIAQYTMGEPGLGTRFLCMSLGATALTVTGIALCNTTRAYYGENNTFYAGRKNNTDIGLPILALGTLLMVGVDIWSIINAYNVVKVKSLYHEDMKKMNRQYSIVIAPTVDYLARPNGSNLVPAVGFRLVF